MLGSLICIIGDNSAFLSFMDPKLMQGYNTAGRAHYLFLKLVLQWKKIIPSLKLPPVMNKTLSLTQGSMTLLPLRGAGIYSVFFFQTTNNNSSIYIILTTDSGCLPDNFSKNVHVYLSQGEKVARSASSASISPRGKDIFLSRALYMLFLSMFIFPF